MTEDGCEILLIVSTYSAQIDTGNLLQRRIRPGVGDERALRGIVTSAGVANTSNWVRLHKLSADEKLQYAPGEIAGPLFVAWDDFAGALYDGTLLEDGGVLTEFLAEGHDR